MRQTPALDPRFERYGRLALIVGVVALALAAVGAFISPTEFFQAYLVGAVEGFFQHHLLGMPDPVDRIVEEEWLSTADALSLDRVSSQTRQAAVQHRRLKQAQVLVQAMRDQLLDPPTLRELLMGPSNELDADLVAAVFQHLCDAPEDTALWALFDEATAAHIH